MPYHHLYETDNCCSVSTQK